MIRMKSTIAVNQDQIRKAEKLIRPYIRRTPVISLEGSDFGLDSIKSILFKAEFLQHSGSFKTRGAFTNLLSRSVPPAGVVAASGGNHGVAVAYAAMVLGKPARIFVPSVASPSKTERIRSYGADLVIGGNLYADALEASETWASQSGAMVIHAYDQPETLLGQGTLGMELQEQSSDFDTLLIAVGGGGLIGGVAAWFEGRIKVVAVEPETAPTLDFALRAGKPVDAPAGGVAADSLAPKRVGELMFPIAQNYVQQPVVLVSDPEISQAQVALWEGCRILVEPGGAAAFAALLSRRYVPAQDERVCVILCGANTGKIPA
jgi:threonine dehydratase